MAVKKGLVNRKGAVRDKEAVNTRLMGLNRKLHQQFPGQGESDEQTCLGIIKCVKDLYKPV